MRPALPLPPALALLLPSMAGFTAPLHAQKPNVAPCRMAVLSKLGSPVPYTVDLKEGQTDDDGNLQVNWRTNQGASGTCLIDRTGKVLRFYMASGMGGEPVPPAAPPTKPPEKSTVTCESNESESKECPVPPGSEVRLARVLSEAPCLVGQTWNADGRRIRVWEGCSAEFDVEPAPPQSATDAEAQRACRSEVQSRFPGTPAAQIATEIGGRRGEGTAEVDWQARSGASGDCWVSRRGKVVQFRIEDTGRGGKPVGQGKTNKVVCESQGRERSDCLIPRRSQVRIARQLSKTGCNEGKNWGYDDRRIWVSGGCRAEFEVRPR